MGASANCRVVGNKSEDEAATERRSVPFLVAALLGPRRWAILPALSMGEYCGGVGTGAGNPAVPVDDQTTQ